MPRHISKILGLYLLVNAYLPVPFCAAEKVLGKFDIT